MPTLLHTSQSTVTGLWGSAIVKGADGRARPLKMGDTVRRGDVILTTQDGIVQLTSDPGALPTTATTADPAALVTAPAKPTAATATPGNDVDQVIEQLAQNDADAATAAGLTVGDGGEFLPGLRVDRISEFLTPLSVGNNEATPQNLNPVFPNEGSSADTLANIAPSALDASVSGPENTTLPVALRGVDSDGNVVSVTVTAVPTSGTLLLADGSTVVTAGQTLTPAQAAGLLFRPAADFVGLAVITFFVTDNQGSTSDGATVSLNVGGANPLPNQAPVAVNDSTTVAEDTPANGNVLGNDRDPDGNPLTVTQFVIEGVTYVAGATAVVAGIGSLTLAANGAYTFTPLANYNGPVPVATYTVSDGLASVSATLTLLVNAAPDAPVARDDLASTPVNTPITLAVLGNDSDADGNALVVTTASVDPALGTVTVNANGTLTFNPAGNISGPVVINYTISDGQGGVASATATVNVGPNTPPAGTDATFVIGEDGTRNFSAADFGFSDADAGQSFANVRIDTLPAAGSLTLAGVPVSLGQVIAVVDLTQLVYAPAANANGSDYARFTFSVQDSSGAFDASPNQITIDVTAGADIAVITGTASGATVEDSTPTTGGTLTVVDPDAGQAAFNPRTDVAGAHGVFSIDAAGVWTYTLDNTDPAVQALGAGQTLPNEAFTVTTIDGTSQVVTVTITGTNDAPVAQDASVTVTEDAPLLTGSVIATDTDANAVLAFSLNAAPPPGLTFNPNGSYTFDASNAAYQSLAAGQTQVLTIPYTVTDDQGASSTANLVITLTGTNDAAVISGVAVGSVTEDGVPVASGALTVSDVDSPASFVAASATGTYGDFAVNASGAWTYTLRNSDANVQALTSAQRPVESFTVTSADGTTSTVTVTVNGTNEPPVAVVTPASGNEDAAGIPVTLGGTDLDGSIASFTITSLPTNGVLLFGGNPVLVGQVITATAGSAMLSFVPTENFNGSTAFDFTATDNEGAVSPSVNAPITVSADNDAPAAVNDSFATLEDIPVTINVRGNDGDADGDPLTVTEVNGSPITAGGAGIAVTGGVVTLNGAGNLVFTPALNYNGTPSFTYTVADPTGAISTATVSGTVTPQNDAPVARSDDGSVTASQTLIVLAAEGVIQSTTVAAGRDTDVDGDALSVTRVSAGMGVPTTAVPSGGVTIAGTFGDLLLQNDGSYTYVASRANAVTTGTQVDDVFTYQVSDSNGGFATAALTLHVGGTADTLNAAPPTTATLTATLGLNGEYYGYNDFNPGPTSPNRRHADDGSYGNLDSAADLTAIVNGRNAVFGGGAVAGSSAATTLDAADARFLARTVDYGGAPVVTSSLGTNSNIAAGGSTAGMTNGNSQLHRFLNRAGGGDADTLSVRRGTADNDQLGGGPTSGLGRTSDAAIRLSGQAYLAAGLYDIRVLADDGFRLRLNNQTVAASDDIQSPTTRVYTGVPIDGGLMPLELLYWEQGGNAVLRIEFKLSGADPATYQVLGSQNLPLFSDANAPTLSALQDIVAGPTPGSYLVRTGSMLDGGNGDDTLTGSAGRDILIGGQGSDTLIGGAGDDSIRGSSGDDLLIGGAGHDVFRWSLGDAGSAGGPARDVISDFDNTPHGGDVLDLRDLLVGESHAANTVALPGAIGLNNALTITSNEGNLADYLHFSTVGGNTVVEISSTGGFSGSYTPAAVDQVITLTGLNLVGSFSNDNQVINDLLQRGKLVTD